MGELERLGRLVEGVYDTVLDPEGWSRFLAIVTEVLECRAPGIGIGGSRPGWQVFAMADEQFVRAYDEQFAVELAKTALEMRLIDSAFDVERLSPGHKGAWRFFADWIGPQGLDSAIGFYTPLSDGSLMGFGIYRERGRRGFDSEDHRLLNALCPHLKRAGELRGAMQRANLARMSLEAVLEQLALGLVLLDQDGNVLVANDVAQGIARRRDGIELSASCLRLRGGHCHRRFEKLVRDASTTTFGGGGGHGGAMFVDRGSHLAPYEVVVSPAPRSLEAAATRRAAVLVLIHDTERVPAPSVDVLRDLYALTAAEARIASQLASGSSIDEIAGQARVSRETIRNQLKAVFEKTGTHRQAELTHRLRSGLATSAPKSPR